MQERGQKITHLRFPSTHTRSHTTNLPLKPLFSDEKKLTVPNLPNQRAPADLQSANNIKAAGSPLSKSMLVSTVSKLSAQRRVKEEER